MLTQRVPSALLPALNPTPPPWLIGQLSPTSPASQARSLLAPQQATRARQHPLLCSFMAPRRPSQLSSRAHSVFQGSSGCRANGASCSSGLTTTLLASLELGPGTACAELCIMQSMLHAMQRMTACEQAQPQSLRSSALHFRRQIRPHITLEQQSMTLEEGYHIGMWIGAWFMTGT